MWQRRMSAFLRGKGWIIWDVFRALYEPEFDRVQVEDLACKIWEKLKVAHGGNNQVKDRLFATYRMEYENFTHLSGEYIDSMF
jgi:hypothetical protein